jgi:hypothetical protein
MFRKLITYLKKWKSDPYRKPLILQGADRLVKPILRLNSDESSMRTSLISILKRTQFSQKPLTKVLPLII